MDNSTEPQNPGVSVQDTERVDFEALKLWNIRPGFFYVVPAVAAAAAAAAVEEDVEDPPPAPAPPALAWSADR